VIAAPSTAPRGCASVAAEIIENITHAATPRAKESSMKPVSEELLDRIGRL
jgi:hypothetical protein